MKIIDAVLFLLFITFAAVQVNDPDPFIWVTIYGVVALISILRIFGIFQRGMVMLLFVFIGLYALLHVQFFWGWLTEENAGDLFGEMVYENPNIEGTREFLGLILADAALVFHLFWKRT